MNYFSAKPSSLLAPYVKQYWAIENCLPAGKEHIQRIVPTGMPDLTFYFQNKPRSLNGLRSFTETSVINGQQKDYYDISISGQTSLFSILFQPHGLSALLNIPLNVLFKSTAPLKDVVKNVDIGQLEDRLFEAASFEDRVTIAESFLVQLLQRHQSDYQFKRITKSIGQINKSLGLVTIDELASGACFSRKQFERVFSATTGISPKQFLRIVRFQNAINQKSIDRTIDLTSLTYLCGYYDQAHMTNDFQKLTGMNPSKLFKGNATQSDYFG